MATTEASEEELMQKVSNYMTETVQSSDGRKTVQIL